MSSTKFTVPRGVKKIDVFCVGGGGGFETLSSGTSGSGARGGGGGGFTTTVLGASVTPGQQLSVVVGSFASASSVGEICSANGGTTSGIIENASGSLTVTAGNGGSGGGASVYYNDDGVYLADLTPGNGGSDGGDGGLFTFTSGYVADLTDLGKGQGTTTRYFGETNGTLYAGGGGGIAAYLGFWEIKNYKIGSGGAGGGGNALSPGATNTGGGGGAYRTGGSGICIIRWDDQKS